MRSPHLLRACLFGLVPFLVQALECPGTIVLGIVVADLLLVCILGEMAIAQRVVSSSLNCYMLRMGMCDRVCLSIFGDRECVVRIHSIF